MKLKLTELKALIRAEMVEAKKKRKKGEPIVQPHGYQTDETLDFSAPMGAENRYRRQGAANFGPLTAEGVLRLFIRNCIREGAANVSEKHIGFKKLKKMLSKKGVKDPAALAASIGRKKLGDAEMAKRAAAGKKKK